MNDAMKEALGTQGARVMGAVLRYKTAKAALEVFDANSRNAVKADGVKRTEADTDALVTVATGRSMLVDALCKSEAELEGYKTDTQCLLAHVSLVCSETAAMSRISQ